jgi:regulatory protein
MKITKIESQKKRKNRFNIYTNDQFVCGLSEDTIIDSGLAVGQEITQNEIEKLIEKDQASKAFEKAIRFLGYRIRTEKEVRDKLSQKEFDQKVIDKILKKLKKMNYINDQKFIEDWVKDRISIKPTGKKLLKFELRQKGIDEIKTQKQLDKLVNEKSELSMAQKALSKAEKQYKNLVKKEAKQKIISYLARRGFDWTLIKKLLDKNQ